MVAQATNDSAIFLRVCFVSTHDFGRKMGWKENPPLFSTVIKWDKGWWVKQAA